MGEIKSTLEIILDKTKDLTMSPDELKHWKREEKLKEASILVRKYINRDINIDDLLKNIDNDEALKDATIYRLVENVSLLNNNENIFSAISLLKGKDFTKEKETISLLGADYKKEREEMIVKIGKELKNKFERIGISGNALIPNVEDSKEGKEALKDLHDTYINRVNEILKAIHSSHTK
jgi:hypothetical protein